MWVCNTLGARNFVSVLGLRAERFWILSKVQGMGLQFLILKGHTKLSWKWPRCQASGLVLK